MFHHHPSSPDQSVLHLAKETDDLSSFPLSISIWEALSFVLILTFHIFINVNNILLMCFLNYFSLSWSCPSLWELVDLWALAAICWWILGSYQLAVLVQHSENNYQSKFTFSSWHITFPWSKPFQPIRSHMFCGIGREVMFLRPQAFGDSLSTVPYQSMEEPRSESETPTL